MLSAGSGSVVVNAPPLAETAVTWISSTNREMTSVLRNPLPLTVTISPGP